MQYYIVRIVNAGLLDSSDFEIIYQSGSSVMLKGLKKCHPLCCVSSHHNTSIYKWTRLEQGEGYQYPSTPVLHVKKAGTYQCVVHCQEQQQKSHIFVVKCLLGDNNWIRPKHLQTSFQLIRIVCSYCFDWENTHQAKYAGSTLTNFIYNTAFIVACVCYFATHTYRFPAFS